MLGKALLRVGINDRAQVRCFSQLHSALLDRVAQFPAKDVLRVSSQGIRWNIAQLNQHSEAFAKGLVALGFDGSTGGILSALKPSGEHVAVTIGSNYAGVDAAVVDSGEIKDAKILKKLLSETNCRGLIVSGADVKTVYEAIPELKQQPKVMTETLSLSEFPSLKYVVQTGYETQIGMHRFKDIMCYHSLVPLPVEKNAGSLTIIDASNGTLKNTLTEADLLAKSQEAPISTDEKVVLAKDEAVAATFASVACALNLAKLVVPTQEKDTHDLELEEGANLKSFAI
mmetsp:Transcript_10579/g.13262  ORF Transcript_10579/g.13262 Transcript_10579/m.13262 type:complete len:285 (+) Transcript_10579:148-1002(+)|eukprot:CAMPEP_0204823188 /NCGR_PEP_ID=MMETSP1346-20131115/1282_1 /ASSEMBLY_ACC=CAM_ASM_000771 /TAXON_ID=215587 /ORGANISM="Aplanochytrium stocchinoi, Strain GSBS06" /LENGTH=284 /DNA_ID=CAMNT_0051949739 /DNA_START=134 /DNA_END=988 /DNA_ORIENTATION=+